MADHGCYREEVQSAVSRWGSYSAMAGAPARLFFFESQSEGPAHHFLDACFLCRMPLGRNRDIFMYRGDTPFCSEECRQEQIEMDEAREKSIAMSMKAASSRKEQKKQADQAAAAAAAAAQGIEVRAAGAVLAV